MMAMTTEIAINMTINMRMERSCFFSSIFFMIWPFKKSIVNVELEAITNEDNVDMEADSTKMTTSPIRAGERLETIAGIIASNPSEARSMLSPYKRPKPPRK